MAMNKARYTRDLTVYPHPFSLSYWRAAVAELSDLRTLIFAALIIAIRVALKRVYIPVGENLSIYVGFVFTAVGGSIYGPVIALIAGTITDLLGFVVAPTGPFNPWFTLVEVLATFLYALILYRQRITFGRLFLSKLSVNLLSNVMLQSWVMSISYGKAMYIYMAPRIVKNIVMLPFEVLLLCILFGALIVPLIRLHMYAPEQNALVLKKSSYVILGVVSAVMLIGALIGVLHYDAIKTAFKTFFESLFQK